MPHLLPGRHGGGRCVGQRAGRGGGSHRRSGRVPIPSNIMDLLCQDGQVLSQVLTEPATKTPTKRHVEVRVMTGAFTGNAGLTYLAISALCVDQFSYGSTSFWSSTSSVSTETDLVLVVVICWLRGFCAEGDG